MPWFLYISAFLCFDMSLLLLTVTLRGYLYNKHCLLSLLFFYCFLWSRVGQLLSISICCIGVSMCGLVLYLAFVYCKQKLAIPIPGFTHISQSRQVQLKSSERRCSSSIRSMTTLNAEAKFNPCVSGPVVRN